MSVLFSSNMSIETILWCLKVCVYLFFEQPIYAAPLQIYSLSGFPYNTEAIITWIIHA